MSEEAKNKMVENAEKTLLVGHIGQPDTVAEAYLFLMKLVIIFLLQNA